VVGFGEVKVTMSPLVRERMIALLVLGFSRRLLDRRIDADWAAQSATENNVRRQNAMLRRLIPSIRDGAPFSTALTQNAQTVSLISLNVNNIQPALVY
jgi:hypothetical protein